MPTSGTPPTGPAYFITDNSGTGLSTEVDDLWPGTRPYLASNGNIVVPLVHYNAGTDVYTINMWASSDGGTTFAIADSGNSFTGPTQADFNAVLGGVVANAHNAGDCFQDGDTLYLAYWAPTTVKLCLVPFDMTTLSWGAALTTAGPDFYHTSGQAGPGSVLLAKRADGSYIAMVQYKHTITAVDWPHIKAWQFDGAWTDLGQVVPSNGDASDPNEHYLGGLWIDSTGAVNLLWAAENRTPAIFGWHSISLSTLNAYSTDLYLLDADGTATPHPPGWATGSVFPGTCYTPLLDGANSAVYTVLAPSLSGSLDEADPQPWISFGGLPADGSILSHAFLDVNDQNAASPKRMAALILRTGADNQAVVFRERSHAAGSTYFAYFYMPVPLASGQHRALWCDFWDDGTAPSLIARIQIRTQTTGSGAPAWNGSAGTFYSSTWALSNTDPTRGSEAVRVMSSIPGSAPLAVVCDSPPSGAVGVAYSHFFPASGGVAPYTWAIVAGALPTGLTLDTGTGEVSGTPTIAGIFAFTVQVTDSSSSISSVDCSISIVGGQVGITCGDPPAGLVGIAYSHVLPVTGGVPPLAFVLVSGSLPTGLALGASTGVISGVPSAVGAFIFRIRVTDSTGATADVTCVILIGSPEGNCPDAPEDA